MAADLLGSMRVEIVGDNSQLDRSIDQSETKAKGFSKSLKKLFTGIAFVAVAKGIANVSSALITAASDAEETTNKFNVVFGNVIEDAEAAKTRIQDVFKLSDATTEKFLSQVGDITSGLGATSSEALEAAEKITTLGLDIDSFANLSGGAEQAVSALTSLFTGEREAAKALGIVINDTNLKAYAEDMGKIFKELTPLEKGFLSLELATKQSQLAIGDFARSEASFANQSKIAKEAVEDLKVSIGKNLLPAATEMIGIFGELTTKLVKYIDEHNKLRTLLDKFENDTDTAQDRVDLTEREIAATQKLYDENLKILTLRQGTAQSLQDEEAIDALFEKASLLNTELRAKQRLLETLKEEAAAEKEVTDALKAKEAEVARLAAVQLDLASTLETRRKAALSDDDLAIDSIQRQIDKWSQFRDIIGVQELLNALIEERNELLEGNIEAIEFHNVAYDEAHENMEFAHRKFTDATLDDNEEIAESEEELRQKRIDSAIEVAGIIQDILDQRVANARAASEEFLGINGVEIDSLTAKAKTEEGLNNAEQARLNALNAEKKRLANEQYDRELEAFKVGKAFKIADTIQAGANAAINAFNSLAGIPLVGPVLGGIAAAAVGILTGVQVGLIASQAAPPKPAFAQGGIVAGNSFVGDKIPVMADSGEMFINRKDQNDLMSFIKGGSNGNGGGNTTVNAIIDKKVLFSIMLNGSKQGQLQFDKRSLIN